MRRVWQIFVDLLPALSPRIMRNSARLVHLGLAGHPCGQQVILIQPWSLAFPDPLGPPGEAHGRADAVGVRLEGDAARSLGLFEVVDGGEMPVVQCRVGQWPEMLGGLQLGGVGGQEQEVQMLGDAQLDAGVPPGAIQDQDDLLGGAGADRRGEGRKFDLEERDTDGGR